MKICKLCSDIEVMSLQLPWPNTKEKEAIIVCEGVHSLVQCRTIHSGSGRRYTYSSEIFFCPKCGKVLKVNEDEN